MHGSAADADVDADQFVSHTHLIRDWSKFTGYLALKFKLANWLLFFLKFLLKFHISDLM